MSDRRKFLKKSIIGSAGLVFGAKAVDPNCVMTPAQTEGPFYPIEDQLDTDTDLIFVKGRKRQAKGKVVIVRGQVLDQHCKPVENALVEIWQACESGKYKHPNDPNPAKLDENFQYWGRTLTNREGKYAFRTIIPGAYPATNTWIRPPHIHFKVSLRGYEELTTQMYFAGEALNKTDRILQGLSRKEKENVIVQFRNIKGVPTGDFNIGLNKLF